MDRRVSDRCSRRRFLGGFASTGAIGLLGSLTPSATAEPPPETTSITLAYRVGLACHAPLQMADDFLRGEGFTRPRYVGKETIVEAWQAVASGEAQVTMALSAGTITLVDKGEPIVFLAGIHVGCLELFATERVRTVRDLKGKRVAVVALGSNQHVFLATMLAHVGLDPRTDVTWLTHSMADSVRLLEEGRIDAFLAVPPETQQLRAKKVGHVIVNTMMDRPWSQYFCCIATGNRDFVAKNPVATKRVLRAILKATDVCAREPERVTRVLVDRGYAKPNDFTLQALKETPYGSWREYHPEDTIRFYALRLREAGFIASSPQKILARGTDWRFLNELRKELKG